VSDGITVAIVGGGASGTLAAIALLRHTSIRPRRVVVFEGAEVLGDGVAYRTRSPAHVLNVRASAMSALPDIPSDFADHAVGRGVAATDSAFVERRAFSDYLRDTLARARRQASAGVGLEHRRTSVVDVRPDGANGGWVARSEDGTAVEADVVVLATGNRQVRPAWLGEDPAVVVDPWMNGSVERLAGAGDVLIVGMALTAVDAALSLRDAGHRGTIVMTSAHGRLPAPHLEGVLPPTEPAVTPGDPGAATVRGSLHALRSAARDAADWRQAVDGLRPVTVELWRGLDHVERRRALRHVARRWEVHRHRMAPDVARQLAALQAEGRLRTERGRVTRVEPSGGRLRATLIDHGQERVSVVDGVILCTGPVLDPAADPLLGRLIDRGVIRSHPLRIGLDLDEAGRVLAPDGRAWPTLHAMGGLRKGAEWESTAIPEIRGHARHVADAVLGV
jgi:uncharacterized NAD(P)/FAD-binding protein YdhS